MSAPRASASTSRGSAYSRSMRSRTRRSAARWRRRCPSSALLTAAMVPQVAAGERRRSVGDRAESGGHEVGSPEEPADHHFVAVLAAASPRGDPAGHDAGEVGHVVSAAGAAVDLLGAVCDLAVTVQYEAAVAHRHVESPPSASLLRDRRAEAGGGAKATTTSITKRGRTWWDAVARGCGPRPRGPKVTVRDDGQRRAPRTTELQ